MGNTCASAHAYFVGNPGTAAQAVSRAYTQLGYERVKKSGDKHVIVTRSGQCFLSVHDSGNARLDNGELKQVALAISKSLKGPALVTSLHDSDSFEFIVFYRGKQIDLLMTDIDAYSGPLQVLPAKKRAQKWSVMASRNITDHDIQNACRESVFADDIVDRLAALFSLSEGQCQVNFDDLKDENDDIIAEYFFAKTKVLDLPVGSGSVVSFRDYFDPDNSRAHLFYPSGYPIALDDPRGFPWLLISEGAGFDDGKIEVRITGPKGLEITEVFVKGVKFHNGQIVGDLETAPVVKTMEDAEASRKRHSFVPVLVSSSDTVNGLVETTLEVRFANLKVPTASASRGTQILLLVQPHVVARACGDWNLQLMINAGETCDEPSREKSAGHQMPGLRLIGANQTWLPVVSGLANGIVYNTIGLDAGRTGASMVREFQYQQQQVRRDRRLEFPGALSNVVILREQPDALEFCSEYVAGWLDKVKASDNWELFIWTEREMTASANITKNKKIMPLHGFRSDKNWRKLFEFDSKLQTMKISLRKPGSLVSQSGLGYQRSLISPHDREYCSSNLKQTLHKMRGREFNDLTNDGAVHLFSWVLNHPDVIGAFEASSVAMENSLDEFVASAPVLQAWHAAMTWIPAFDCGGEWVKTLYESNSVLNWFRGISGDDGGIDNLKMLESWCANVLRMVSPYMWLGESLMSQIDRSALEQVAELVSNENGLTRVKLRSDANIAKLEMALLPILPVESVRISKAE